MVLCKFGFHKFSEWETMKTDAYDGHPEMYKRICKKCNKIDLGKVECFVKSVKDDLSKWL